MRSNLFLLPAIVALCIAQASYANDKIVVTVPAILDPSAPIGENVRRECSVETNVGTQIFQKVSERFPGTEQTPNPNQAGSDRIVLKVTIVGVLGAGGGAWSGSKSITIRADVLQNAKVAATRTLNRQSKGWGLGGVNGTCAIMDHIAVALGKDVAAWLPVALQLAKLEASSAEPSTASPAQEGAASPTATDKPASEPKQ